MKRDDIIRWLRETDEGRLEELWRRADEVRRENVGDEVHLRGLIEFSNVCRRRCGYCGLRAANAKIERYRMSVDEILECARQAHGFGYGTVVLQSGEDMGINADWMAGVIARIRAELPLAITLSLGERADDELKLWKDAGADRYLLRFETSNEEVYARIHPPLGEGEADQHVIPSAPIHRGSEESGFEGGEGEVPRQKSGSSAGGGRILRLAPLAQDDIPRRTDRSGRDRIRMLRTLKTLGYEAGSGVMIGIPGTTYEDLAKDILLFRELDLDMIGVGPYILHPGTPLGRTFERELLPADRQAPNTELMCYKVVALARIVQPLANIPSTTALATLNLATGRELGLQRGANVVMPNVTPVKYRAHYEIYPSKACIFETGEQCRACITKRILSIGRKVGAGRGDSRNRRAAATT